MGQPRHRVPDPEAEDDNLNGKMGFLEHLEELRTRLIRSCIAIGAGMLIAFLFVDRLADFVLAPTLHVLAPGSGLIMTRLGEGLSFYLDLALIGGVLLAAPYVTYQVWSFIAPGLYSREKRLIVPFIVLTTLGTLSGAAFSHYALFPSMVAFFKTFDSPRIRLMPRLEDTFELYKNMLIAMVAVFQIPTLVYFLARMRLVTARFLWRHIKYAVLISFIVAAVLTPSPDPWNQTAFALPMIALYVVSIGVAWMVAPKDRRSSTSEHIASGLTLVVAATVLDQAARRRKVRGEYPRLMEKSR